jgi:hypothetical protein
MDTSTVRIIAWILFIVVLGVIIMRRRKKAAE